MRKRYLGDVLDFYKRWFLREACTPLISDLSVLPMFTEEWRAEEIDVYAAILSVSRDQVSSQLVRNQRDRREYFGQVRVDTFVDPDTGLRILHERPQRGGRKQRPQWSEFFFLPELDLLLPEGSDRVVVVYDQSIGRGSERESVEVKLRSIRPYLGIAYVAQAGMFVLGREPSRVRLMGLRDMMLRRADVQKYRLSVNF